jgi:FtsH-binding integral membrane protein
MSKKSDFNHYNEQVVQRAGAKSRANINEGLRTYMLGVYNYMTLGVALTAVIAYFAAAMGLTHAIQSNQLLSLAVMFAPLGFVFFLSFRINHMQAGTAQALFWVYSALMGLSLSFIFLAYVELSILRVFFITSGTFAAMSLYGYTTKKDLTGMGSFLMMGLFGIIIASIVNWFMASSALNFAISVIGVLIFTGLTAYDTQQIKHEYYAGGSSEDMQKQSIMGALRLYLDFINLFLMLLRLLGDRK